MSLHGKSFVAGAPSIAEGMHFQPTSPLDGRLLNPAFYCALQEDIDTATEEAESAFPVYSELPTERRALLLKQIAEEIENLGDPLIDRSHLETALPQARLVAERGRTCAQLRLFAQLITEGSWVDARIDTAQPDRIPQPRPDLRRMLVALGPVAVFGASNFPLAFSVAGGDTASALAAGCTVVVKGHEAHPGTSEMVAAAVAQAVRKCDLPGGVFSMLQGRGPITGMALVEHPLVKAVGFTGSHHVGREIFNAAANRPEPIPVFAEMASLNPVYLLPGALQERPLELAVQAKTSVTMGVGQFCTKPGLILGIKSPAFDLFKETLAVAMANEPDSTMLHFGIAQTFQARVAKLSSIGGISFLAQSQHTHSSDSSLASASLAAIDAASFLRDHENLNAEVFGPFCLIVTAESLSELERISITIPGQLTATIHTGDGDMPSALRLASILKRKAGRIVFNGFPTGVEVSPAMTHGGPYPATTDSRFTSVGTAAILRFVRPVTFQDFPQEGLPIELRDSNVTSIHRLINGQSSCSDL